MKISDLFYILSKVGFSPLRGLLLRPFMHSGSSLPLIGRNVKFLSISRLKVGRLAYIGHNSYVDCECESVVELGIRSTIREGAWIQCRSGLNLRGIGFKLGNRAYIGPGSVIGVGGRIVIGDGTQAGSRLTLISESHDNNNEDRSYVSGDVKRKGIVIGKNCWLGSNVTILDGVEIGDNSVVGAGSVVTKSIPEKSMCYGVPAKVVRKL